MGTRQADEPSVEEVLGDLPEAGRRYAVTFARQDVIDGTERGVVERWDGEVAAARREAGTLDQPANFDRDETGPITDIGWALRSLAEAIAERWSCELWDRGEAG